MDTGETFVGRDLSGARFRDCDLTGARFDNVEGRDITITGELEAVSVNGVEVMGYVEAELDRRHPERPLLRSADPDDLRAGWARVQADWRVTEERIAALPPGLQRARVDDEWSAWETLRHLVYATDAWIGRSVRGEEAPFWPGALPWSTAAPEFRVGTDPDADPSLAEVLAVRRARAAAMGDLLAGADAAVLAARADGARGPGWPTESMELTVLECVHVVLNEEWWHHRYCLRDLDRLSDETP